MNKIKLLQPIFVSDSQLKENSSFMNFLRYLFCAIWIVGVFFFSITPLFAAEKILHIEKITHSSFSLTPYFYVLEDRERSLTFQQIQTEPFARRFKNDFVNDALNFGYSGSAYWLRLNLENSGDTQTEKFLEITYPFLAHIDFYQSQEGSYQHLQTGYAVNFSNRPYKNRLFILPISLPAHSISQIYLRIQTPNAVMIPARLWDKNAFHDYEYTDNSIQFLYFGIAIAMIFYNLFLFGILRDVSYLWYVLFSIFSVFTILFYTGQASVFFSWLDSFRATNVGVNCATALMFIFLLLFMRQMLNTATLMPGLDRLIKLFIGINAFLPFVLPIKHINIIILATTLLVFITSLIGMFKHQRSAYLFLTSFACFLVIIIIKALKVFSFLPVEIENIGLQLQLGSASEMLLFSIILADRYNLLRHAKEDAQQQLVTTLQSSERMLETKVKERTENLEKTSKQLQILIAKERAHSVEKSNFLTMLTHELKSPLATIQIATGNLQTQKKQEMFALCIKHIQEAISDMTGIIERCIEADKLEKTNSNISFSHFPLRELVEELVLRLNAVSQVQIHISPDFSIMSDFLLCRTILNNLLDNALKYSPENTQVIISAKWQSDEKASVIISVRNQIGDAGKPDESKVFVKYYRNTQVQRLRGTGLGLWLVKGIATQLGGDVRYIPHENEVEFECFFPNMNAH